MFDNYLFLEITASNNTPSYQIRLLFGSAEQNVSTTFNTLWFVPFTKHQSERKLFTVASYWWVKHSWATYGCKEYKILFIKCEPSREIPWDLTLQYYTVISRNYTKLNSCNVNIKSINLIDR